MTCWRPRGDSIIYELRRFFIGGSPELADISYVAVPSDHEGPVLSRMGFRTTTTGNLKIRLNTVFQSQSVTAFKFFDDDMILMIKVNLLLLINVGCS